MMVMMMRFKGQVEGMSERILLAVVVVEANHSSNGVLFVMLMVLLLDSLYNVNTYTHRVSKVQSVFSPSSSSFRTFSSWYLL